MILALETSTPNASLALWDESRKELVWSSTFHTDRSHNSVIFQPVEEALEKCDRKLDAVAVGLGPGSYSGVRVGIAVANGLAISLGTRALGLSSLEAYLPGCSNYLVIGDARRNTGFIASIREGKLQGEPELIEMEPFAEKLQSARSGNLPVVTPDKKMADQFDDVTLTQPVAELIARKAATIISTEGCEEISPPLEPHYLRPPFITKPKKKKAP